MKTNVNSISLLLLSLLWIASSCAPNELEVIRREGNSNEIKSIPFKIELNTTPKTRTVNNGMSTAWSSGDEVNVFHVVSGGTEFINDGKFTISDVDNGIFVGSLNSELDEGVSYDWYVSYPYNADLSSPANDNSGYSLVAPKLQTQTGNDDMGHLACLALVGKGTTAPGSSDPIVQMKQTASIVKVVVTNNSGSNLPITAIKISTKADTDGGHSDIKISGDYYINFTDPTNIVYSESSTSNTSVLLNTSYQIPSTGSNTGVFYIAVKPFTALTNDVIKLKVNNYEKTIKLSSEIVFPSAEISTFNFNYNQPWVEESAVIATGLPILYVETIEREEPTFDVVSAPEGMAGAGITNATKVPGRVFIEEGGAIIYDSGDYVKKSSGMTIKVRGNTSAYASKKPYKIKLEKKGDMLSRGDSKYEDKNWILVKDESLKYKIGFKVNELVGLQWTPSYIYVNVIFNGEYRGLYMLLESVERNSDCRLNVKKTGGFIFELDAYWWNEDRYFNSGFDAKMNYTYKYPDTDDLTEEQNTYISNYLTLAEASLLDGSYSSYIDIDSFASWILGHDILGNTDGAGSNWFFTKYDNTTDTKIMMGPLWDFDAIMSSTTWDSAHMRYWFYSLFNNTNKSFVRAYKEKWALIKSSVFNDIKDNLDSFAASEQGTAYDKSLLLDNTRWSTSNSTISTRVNEAKTWFDNRSGWLEYRISLLDDQD